jgi:hypothetical protein
MALSNSTRLHIIDPTVFNNQRCEFRLDDLNIANLLLVNVGVTNNYVDGKQTGVFYNSINGVFTPIGKLSVFSGSTLIDEIQEAQAYAAIQHLKTSNQGSEDLSRFELLNGISLTPNGANQNLTTQASHKDYVQTYDLNGGVVQFHNNQIQVAASGNADFGPSGMLTLANYLQFLASVQILPMIPNLRIVIEWSLSINDYYTDDVAPVIPTGSFSPMRPQLIFTEVLGMAPQTSPVQLPFTSTIVERFVVPAVTNGQSKYTSFRSGAFRERFVHDLTFFNRVRSNDGWMLAKTRSPAQAGEFIQLVVNSVKFLPDTGISSEAMKLRYFNDTQGSLNVTLASALESVYDINEDGNSLFDDKASKLAHNFSVTAVSINTMISRLDIEYTRRGSNENSGTDQLDEFDLLVFGKCSRLLTITNGLVRLSY